ncbi:MAG: hypothetical protein LBS97_05875 [Treponema sp.]|jgi:hypothetical protein|nr:hypothetical protein [Treponema sp.]
MVKKLYQLFALCILGMFVFASCKSAPKPESAEQPAPVVQPEPQPAPAPDTSKEDAERNAAALADIEAARNKAIEAGAETFCPDELSALDKALRALKDSLAQNPADTTVAEKAPDLTLRYKALEKAARALAAKDAVDSLGLAQFDPDSYAEGEAALDTLGQADPLADDAQTLSDTAEKAADAYIKVLAAGVSGARGKAINAGADAYCADDLAKLDESLNALGQEYERNPSDNSLPGKGRDLAAQYQALEQAALDAAYASLAESAKAERTAAVQAKARVDGIKSEVTEKDAYGSAQTALAHGDELLAGRDAKNAIAEYRNAREIFDAVFERVSIKRQQASEAMRRATEQTAEVEAFAQQADNVEAEEVNAEGEEE